ncbi:uncharacterized protein LOC129616393 [Condylostylus longicornis]|uniref:uncharacterized protein LOC129616393 n=1 Tax=Condylostylus longicornis TaxID=2530218 RepID=UPI00244DE879|nr:uncharacterized protein LOC129616393 [Condylostylus longicornis]
MERKRQHNTRNKRYNTQKLQNPQTANRYASRLRERLPLDQEHPWEEIVTKIQETAEETLGREQGQRKKWISDETWDLINKRRNAKQLATTENNNRSPQYQSLAKQVKKAARRDKRRYLEQMASQAEQHANQNNMRSLHRIIGNLTGQKENTTRPVRDRNGNLVTNEEAQLEVWKQHFESISNITYSSSEETHDSNPIRRQANLRISEDPPSIGEIKTAIRALKHNRAAGSDGITAELLQADALTTAQLLEPHISRAWSEESVAQSWKKGLIIKLPKKGNLTHCDNWRGITLLNISYKVLATIIQNRLREKLENTIREEQAGIQNTTIHALRGLQEGFRHNQARCDMESTQRQGNPRQNYPPDPSAVRRSRARSTTPRKNKRVFHHPIRSQAGLPAVADALHNRAGQHPTSRLLTKKGYNLESDSTPRRSGLCG